MATPHTPMSIEAASDFLHLDVSDVRALARHGEIPCEIQGDEFLFRKGQLRVWSSQRILGLRGKHLHKYHSRGVLKPHDVSAHAAIIADLTSPQTMEPELKAKTRASLMRRLVEIAERTGLLYDPADLVQELVERENLCSTGLDGGIAVLHPRHHDPYMVEDSFICVGRTPVGIPFGAPDGQRTDLFFLVCCQDDRIHLHVLSRICLLCHETDMLAALRQAASGAEMFQALESAEKALLAAI